MALQQIVYAKKSTASSSLVNKSLNDISNQKPENTKKRSNNDDDLSFEEFLQAKKNPLLCRQIRFAVQHASDDSEKRPFPKNVTKWLSKVTWLQQNEHYIGQRWLIHTSYFTSSISDEDTMSGFKLLQTVDHIRNESLYPFLEFQRAFFVDPVTCSIDHLDKLMQSWAKMLFFILTGNETRHPWIYTVSLHAFCNSAAESMPEHSKRYSELHEVAKSFKLMGDELASADHHLNFVRLSVPANDEKKANEVSLGDVLYEKINKKLDKMKLWWPVQLIIKQNDKANQGQEWIKRLSNMKSLPANKKQFYESFFIENFDQQHSSNWKSWLEQQPE